MMRVKWDPSIRNMDDSVEKFLPAVAAVGRAALANPAVREAGKQVAIGAGTAIAGKLMGAKENKKQKEQELAQAEQELEAAEAEEGEAPPETPEQPKPEAMPPQATQGSQIQGFKGNEQPGNPTEQPGTMAAAPPTTPPPISKSYFLDNFGIEGSELISLLEKGGEESIIPQVLTLLKMEQQSVLKQFDWWEDRDWDLIQLHDNDYNLLVMYPDRLELPLRQTLAAIKRAPDQEAIDGVWKQWHTRLDAEHRLSRRERGILSTCHETLRKNGDMNAQTLTSYGVKGTTQEIAALIKSYGYLFDVKVVGKGKRGDDRTHYYGTTKPPIFLKAVDTFVGNLWEVGGEYQITKTGILRLFLPFTTKRATDYTAVLKRELGVEGIVWEGKQFVIEGDYAVKKAAEIALPHLDVKKEDACLILAALDGNENAGRVLSYRQTPASKQATLLKRWNVPEEELGNWAEVIVNGY